MKMKSQEDVPRLLGQGKSSHLYLYSAFNNIDCVKAALQYSTGKIVCNNAK